MGKGNESAPASTLPKAEKKKVMCGDDQGTQGAHIGSSLPTASKEREAVKQEKAYTKREKQSYDHGGSIMSKSNSPAWIRQDCPPLAKITAQEGLENHVPFSLGETEKDIRQREVNSLKRFSQGKKKNGTIYQRKKGVFERKGSKIQLYFIY